MSNPPSNQERAFYDNHRNVPVAVTDDDLFEHVRTGAAAPPIHKRQPGEPGVTLDQLMRFFDPKFARKTDDTAEVEIIVSMGTRVESLFVRTCRASSPSTAHCSASFPRTSNFMLLLEVVNPNFRIRHSATLRRLTRLLWALLELRKTQGRGRETSTWLGESLQRRRNSSGCLLGIRRREKIGE